MFFPCSYEHEVLNTSRIEQLKNPQVSVSGRTPYVFEELQQLLEIAARDVRYLLSEEICAQDDDEDTTCVLPNDYCNIPIRPEVEIEYSGSGLPPIRPTIPSTYPSDPPTVDERDPTKSPPTQPTFGPTTQPPEWTLDPDEINGDTDPPTTDEGSASSVQYSLYMVLLLSISVVLLL